MSPRSNPERPDAHPVLTNVELAVGRLLVGGAATSPGAALTEYLVRDSYVSVGVLAAGAIAYTVNRFRNG